MAAKERIVQALSQVSGAICDDCLPAKADLGSRQTAYATCTDLAGRGLVGRGRGRCTVCGKEKAVSWSLGMPLPDVQRIDAIHKESDPANRPWYWEGNVQATLVTRLVGDGYSIQSVADTAARTPGTDIVAVGPDGQELWVSVKGFPTSSPSVQARHWFAGAVFDLVLYRNERPDLQLAVALPDGFTTYARLAGRTAWLREQMPFTIFWIAESGQVRAE